MQGVYLGESYRATDDIGGLRARNYIKLKTLIQSAGGASGGPVFNAAGSIVGIHFAGGSLDDPRFRNTPYWRESLEVAADYLMDALADGVRDLRWPTRGGLGLELDLVPIDDAVKYYGLPASAAAELRSVVAAANAAAAPLPPHHPRPRDRVIVVSGYEPGAPTYGITSKLIAPGDIIYAVGSDTLAGDLLWLERALHQRVNATVPLTTWRYGVKRSVDAPVYDLTSDRVKRFAVWNGAVLHDVSDRTRFVYRVSRMWVWKRGRASAQHTTISDTSHPPQPSVQRHRRLCRPPRRRVVLAALPPRQPPLQNVVHAGQVRGDRAGGRAHAVAGRHDQGGLRHGCLSRRAHFRRRARPAGRRLSRRPSVGDVGAVGAGPVARVRVEPGETGVGVGGGSVCVRECKAWTESLIKTGAFFFSADDFFFLQTRHSHPFMCVCSTPCVFRGSRFGTMGRARGRRGPSFFDYDTQKGRHAKRCHPSCIMFGGQRLLSFPLHATHVVGLSLLPLGAHFVRFEFCQGPL